MSIPGEIRMMDEEFPAERVRAPLLPALLVLAALLPQALNIRPAGILLTMPRLVLLVAVPVILARLLRPRPGSPFRFGLCDAVVLMAGLWMFIAVTMTQGLARAVIGSSVMMLELCGGYFLMRTGLNRPGEAVALARVLAGAIAVDGMLSILDVIARRPVLLQLAGSLTGFDQPWQEDYRHGMMRALGMQEHPIMLGALCAFGAVLSLLVLRGPKRLAALAGCLIGLATSNSSAPILGFLIACCLLAYGRVTAGMAARWQVLMIVSGTLLGSFIMLHPTPFAFLIVHTAAVPYDGFYRLLIWHIVGPLVQASPLFGLGLETNFAESYGVANTIDCFWLASAVNFGMVGSALFGLTLLTACGRAIRRGGGMDGGGMDGGGMDGGGMDPGDILLGRAIGIIVFLYFLIGMTVHFWGTNWILLGIFAGMRAHLGDLSAACSKMPAAMIEEDCAYPAAFPVQRHASRSASDASLV